MTHSQSTGAPDKVKILLVDDQPGKLTSYEAILDELDQKLLKANSAKEALDLLLRNNDIAIILIDVCMPDLDGFELAKIIREHPRFQDTAIIFVSAINITEIDAMKGYELGAVDYVPVPVVPNVLRAKVRVFIDLFTKTRALARMNEELEKRVAERTAQLEAAVARQELLAREVDHRARNALAVIQSIVALTPAENIRSFSESVTGRIRAMATAHNLLSASRWQGVDLISLAKEELAPFADENRIAINGEAVSISPTAAQSLALVLHELATNAAKYGALKDPDGKLTVTWDLCDERLELVWNEDCAVEGDPQSRVGFGSKVIETSIRNQLRGAIEREWRSRGLVCTIRLPRRHFAIPELAGTSVEEPGLVVDSESLRGRRLLVLEDEPLIAMMTCEVVRELNADVLGPFASIADARQAMLESVDAALLDVNVGGELVYGFAGELQSRGVPVVFVTGYHAYAVDEQFGFARVLTKPIERDDLGIALTQLFAPKRVGAG
ncbi:response regulator [Methylocystis parvus]|uniref:histidine kinase n=1 Tax=Methylocystis parvus TaxID=134 RepID=A0A6B8M591_9HYPH|nr:response regulator [Methylocystis parvus]QGM97578.1 response regulator [Methylocystis parvus]WBJ98489.1 response regulator [Methylocystis parvus OBBP]